MPFQTMNALSCACFYSSSDRYRQRRKVRMTDSVLTQQGHMMRFAIWFKPTRLSGGERGWLGLPFMQLIFQRQRCRTSKFVNCELVSAREIEKTQFSAWNFQIESTPTVTCTIDVHSYQARPMINQTLLLQHCGLSFVLESCNFCSSHLHSASLGILIGSLNCYVG